MSQWSVAFASSEDQEGCEQIDNVMGFETASGVHKRAIAEGRMLVACDGGRVIGYLRYGFLWDGELPLIQMIRIAPEARRRGVGKALIVALEQHLRQQRFSHLLSSTDDTNNNSLRFHHSLGFVECGRLAINEDGTQEIFLKKALL